ncbi:MAG: translation initiation factor IF-3 [Clostridiaceae bacterium]|nr:translation initiation factor IF-3 [Clostridiaceae bacterium]
MDFVCSLLFLYQFIFRRCTTISKEKELAINGEIKDKEIRLIDVDGTQIGILSAKEGQRIANSKNLDLVKIAPNANPPVCRIMDYGKYKFEMAKKEKEARKNQHVVNIKEVRISPSIDEHDLNTKINHAIKFLKSGDKVKVTVRFRGREVNHSSLGESLLQRFAESVNELGVVEKKPKLEGRSMAMFIAPKS